MDQDTLRDVEVQLRTENGKTIIDGRTPVPFQSLVGLILQRKVSTMFKKWGNDPVVVTSELLTQLASAPQDSRENRTKLITVTLGVGMVAGVFGFGVVLLVLDAARIQLTQQNLLWLCGGILAVGGVGAAMAKLQRNKKGERLVETMEKITGMFS